ncbi:3TM-type holin, partial [Methylobacterium gnaphalii]
MADTAKILVDRLVPDPAAKAAAQAELEQALAARDVAAINAAMEVAKAQSQVNLAEATGNDRFSARSRPSVGWICAAG